MADDIVPAAVSTAAVTVIVPAYNAAAFLGRTLGSVARQTLRPRETIVIDDGSTDATAAVAARYGARVVAGGRRNPGAARNLGIAAARTPWLAFLDADDVWHPRKLELLLAASAVADVDLVTSDFDEIDADGEILVPRRVLSLAQYRAYARPAAPGVTLLEPALLAASLAEWCIFLPSAVLVRTSFVQRVGAFDETLVYAEDVEFFLRCARSARIALVEQQLLGHVNHAGQLTCGISRLGGQLAVAERVLANPERYHAATLGTIRARLPILRAKQARAELANGRNRAALGAGVAALRAVRPLWFGRAALRLAARSCHARAVLRVVPPLRRALGLIPATAEPVAGRERAGTAWDEVLADSLAHLP